MAKVGLAAFYNRREILIFGGIVIFALIISQTVLIRYFPIPEHVFVVMTGILCLALALCLYWLWISLRPSMRISEAGIEYTNLFGQTSSFMWAEILSIQLEQTSDNPPRVSTIVINTKGINLKRQLNLWATNIQVADFKRAVTECRKST